MLLHATTVSDKFLIKILLCLKLYKQCLFYTRWQRNRFPKEQKAVKYMNNSFESSFGWKLGTGSPITYLWQNMLFVLSLLISHLKTCALLVSCPWLILLVPLSPMPSANVAVLESKLSWSLVIIQSQLRPLRGEWELYLKVKIDCIFNSSV